MIATEKRIPVLLAALAALYVTAGPVGGRAWAEDAAQPGGQADAPDWSKLDAQVERGVAAYDAGDYATAKAVLLPLAEQGHPKAMNMVGIMHSEGLALPKDPKAKCDWYERAAKIGYASAMHNLSICFYLGKGRPKDAKQDLYWSEMAANHGSITAMIGMASLDTNQGPEYRRWMNMAAAHGSRYALVSLWLQGYKDDAWRGGMTIGDFVCVSWRILILDEVSDVCD